MADDLDFTERYNTPLPPEQESAFQDWMTKKSAGGRDISKDLYDYDMRGDWLAGAGRDERGHGTDKFKKPNHPTFSTGSIYHGVDGHEGGVWDEKPNGAWSFAPSRTNLQHYSPDELKNYFQKVEPGNHLTLPAQEPEPTMHENALTDLIGRVFDYGGKTEPPKMIQGDRSTGYPTDADAEFAKQHGYAYGKEWEDFFSGDKAKLLGTTQTVTDKKTGKESATFTPTGATGMVLNEIAKAADNPKLSRAVDLSDPNNAPIKAQLQNVVAKAALAVNRDPIATLGFSPSKTMIDIVTKHANLAGFYSTKDDAIYANQTLQSGSTLVHESIHRGLEMLHRRAPAEYAKAMRGSTVDEESMVRYIMHTTMGNPELGSGRLADEQIDAAIQHFQGTGGSRDLNSRENRAALARLQALAAEEVARKRPGGPR